MTTPTSLASLSDHEVLTRLHGAVAYERHATAHVIELLMEVDARKLWAQQSCSSLFTYCVQVLHFSEHAAYLRIEAARAACRFPVILDRLAAGSLHLTAVSLIASHLTVENHLAVLDAAHHRSKREIEQMVAALRPQADVRALVRKLPMPTARALPEPPVKVEERQTEMPIASAPVASIPLSRPAEVRPLAPERFKVQFTVNRETYDKLRQAQDLLRHVIPNADIAAIFDRALSVLIKVSAKTKCGTTDQPRRARRTADASRHVPATVKREVWTRDAGQCAFRGARDRCTETGWLELHHVVPYARGGPTTSDNLELRCRAHNVYEAEQQFGPIQSLF
jgi:hypothetical protein